MEKNRQKKIYTIIALVVTTFCLTLGFAAFSNTLNISSNATVKPDSSTFGVEFSTISSAVSAGTLTGVASDGTSNGTATLSSTSVTGLQANFVNPGESVTFTFYAHNTGEYDAYLRNITYSNVAGATSSKVCEGASETTTSLVTAACDDITITTTAGNASTTTSLTGISGHKLAKDSYEIVTVTITYATNGDRADGPFSVKFGNIALEYGTADSIGTEISFNVGENTYIALEGMTFADWVDSSYNTSGAFIENDYVCSGEGTYIGDLTDEIIAGATYNVNASCKL